MNRLSPSRPLPRDRHRATAIVAGGAAYFLIVFGAGFVLGIMRTLWLVPRLGVRWAELLEIPVMLVFIYWAAQWVSRWFRLDDRRRPVQAGVGLVGLLLLVGAELALAFQFGDQSPAEYVETRDPVSGTVYALSLVLFALMPVLIARDPNPGLLGFVRQVVKPVEEISGLDLLLGPGDPPASPPSGARRAFSTAASRTAAMYARSRRLPGLRGNGPPPTRQADPRDPHGRRGHG